MKKSFFSTVFLDTLHNLVALLPEPVHFQEDFRRMLQVTVHHSHRISACLCKAGHNCCFFPEISGKMHTCHIFIFSGYFFYRCPGSVRGTVIYQNQFIKDPGLPQELSESPAGFLHHRFLVTGRQNYRYSAHFSCFPLSFCFLWRR